MMNSRERVQAAINHQPPDRVPLDLNPTLTAYKNLKRHLGLHIENDLVVNNAMEVIPHPDVLAALGVDVISVKLPGGIDASVELPERLRDAWGIEYRLVRQSVGMHYEAIGHPLADATLADLNSYPWPRPRLGGTIDALHQHARQLYEQTDLALMGRFGAPILEIAAFLLGMENWYIRLAQDQEFIRALLDRISAIVTDYDLAGIEAAGEYLQIFKVSGEDLGTQNGLMFSPKVFHEVLLPPLQHRWDTVREHINRVNASAKIMLHSCGAIRPLIPDLIEAGIDILDPVQPLAHGMEAAGLKADFGDRLVFHGGIDVQRLLPHGTPDEIVGRVQQCLTDFQGHRGGLILAPSHNVQADVPPENLVAMSRTVVDWRPASLS